MTMSKLFLYLSLSKYSSTRLLQPSFIYFCSCSFLFLFLQEIALSPVDSRLKVSVNLCLRGKTKVFGPEGDISTSTSENNHF